MLNPESSAQAPSRPLALAPSRHAAAAGSRQLAGFGPGAVLRERGEARMTGEAGRKSGFWCGGDSAATGYLPGFDGSFGLGQRAVNLARVSVVTNSTADSTYQHNNIQMARLLPASQGEVGPYPEREPGPA
jgi:hypothetical protein